MSNHSLTSEPDTIEQLTASALRLAVFVLNEHKQFLANQPLAGLLAQAERLDLAKSTAGQTQHLASILLAAKSKPQLITLTNPAASDSEQQLLIAPALMAAKLRCHAHALITGISTGISSDNEDASSVQAALKHAKREHISPVSFLMEAVPSSSAEQEHLSNHITGIAQVSELFTKRALPKANAKIASAKPANAKTAIELAQQDSTQPKQLSYWYTPLHQQRVATLTLCGKQNLTLVMVQGSQLAKPEPLLSNQRIWLPVRAQDTAEMRQQLVSFANELTSINHADDQSGLLRLISRAIHSAEQSIESNLQHESIASAVIMASGVEQAISEIDAMLAAIDASFSDKQASDYKTPAGSCLQTSATSMQQNDLCFVYPGVGTVYPNMFSEFGRYFPALYSELEAEGDLGQMLQADLLDSCTKGSSKDKAIDVSQMALKELAIAGGGASFMLTRLLQRVFNITPNYAMGYSMGEAAMWASLGVWHKPHSLVAATDNSSIFNHDISGELNCVRQTWQLGAHDTINWNSFVVRATEQEIQGAIDAHAHAQAQAQTQQLEQSRVYIAIVQGDTCVIAGCEHSCKQVLKQLGKRGIAANRVTAMHTAPAMLIRDQLKDFYQLPINKRANETQQCQQTQFISAASEQFVALNENAIAESVADTMCQPLDFTKLVNKAHRLGARLFVEVGADRQTSTLVDKILTASSQPATQSERARAKGLSTLPEQARAKGLSTLSGQARAKGLAIATNTKAGDDITSLLKCLAQLFCHQVPMSLDYLIVGLESQLQQLTCNAERLEPHTNSSTAVTEPTAVTLKGAQV
ncbi:PfaB family protein [Shewanella sp. WXL01]|uniref:PfaB family protein n=1 Tax=Shewanella sp. WXL01 TaxID=2709721 RepID=UPI00143848F8|nr:PfaB family protein [Shewanella sp. WXL01]NKF51086.1 PfaB family protein [Shewanella sp. WXL01]